MFPEAATVFCGGSQEQIGAKIHACDIEKGRQQRGAATVHPQNSNCRG